MRCLPAVAIRKLFAGTGPNCLRALARSRVEFRMSFLCGQSNYLKIPDFALKFPLIPVDMLSERRYLGHPETENPGLARSREVSPIGKINAFLNSDKR